MALFDVYTLMDVEPAEAKGAYLWDAQGNRYLDFYGGHAVISIGHGHPAYTGKINDQLSRIGFYSNAVRNPLQEELAALLGEASGYPDYNLFLCNSGAEANENALKLASFATGRMGVLAMKGAFHGRTSGAVAVTDNPAIQAPFNRGHRVTFVDMNDVAALEKELATGEYAALIIEPIQGVGGIRIPEPAYLVKARELCTATGTVLIMDEIQSGYGRTGRFFAHLHADITADMITLAKGMGNGFPIGGVLINPKYQAKKNMLGTTFGGNYLACAAAIAVLEVMREERLTANAAALGEYLMGELGSIPGVREVRGQGLMIGIDLEIPQSLFRGELLSRHKVITGSSGSHTVRLLPPLSITCREVKLFLRAFRATMEELTATTRKTEAA